MIVGHIKSRATHPQLTFIPSNWQIECTDCSNRSAQSVVQDKAARDALKRAGLDPDALFPNDREAGTPPPRPVSLSPSDSEAIEVPERLVWDDGRLSAYPWLDGLLAVPGDAAVPLAMTLPHRDAVGSYGAQAVEWIEQTQRITLRWWQRLAITRQLEHDDQGRLVWRVVVESAPRRAGKSVRLRGVALWRLEHGAALFGEPQLVIHTGKDVAIVREIQRYAWRWAEDVAGWTVTRANGKEALETPGGDRWLARAMHSVYGYDVGLGMVDEAWAVEPAAVDEGMEPATMERPSPQVHLTSTAHRKATSLMRRRIGDALSTDDGETLLLLWAAPPGADPGDPETWRAASPHWTDDRRRMIASKYEKAASGEVDPEADDLDPMAGFTAQYLNRWVLKPAATVVGEAVVSEAAWDALCADVGNGRPDAVAVEGWPGEGLSVALAWRAGEQVTVSVEDVPDVASAAALVRAVECRRPAVVGTSLAGDPAWSGLRVKATSGTVLSAVDDLSRLLNDGVLLHDGGEHLTGQATALQTSQTPSGRRVRSVGRSDAVKAAMWAALEARRRTSGKPRILLPT